MPANTKLTHCDQCAKMILPNEGVVVEQVNADMLAALKSVLLLSESGLKYWKLGPGYYEHIHEVVERALKQVKGD